MLTTEPYGAEVTVEQAAVPFEDLADADLVVDRLYIGGSKGTVGDDPIDPLLGVGNQGGFRYVGSPRKGTVRLGVLYTSGAEVDWPDFLDEQTGLFTYYGDNRRPGHDLHGTPRAGNRLLRDVFDRCHADTAARASVPPFVLFSRAGTTGRDVRFRGLLAPGGASLTPDEDLQAIWRTTGGLRFQNYRARFTVLNIAVVPREWIDEVREGNPLGSKCPAVWREWVEGRSYSPLVAPSTTVIRTRQQQTPQDVRGREIIECIHGHFAGSPHAFESCAVQLWRMLAPATGQVDLTRPSRDGGRDATGVYLLGPAADRVQVDFALEAKCYAPANAVGVHDVARLISRIRHRTFGVFVTTSYFNQQVYAEVRNDQHPIVLLCGKDLVDILRSHGYASRSSVQSWLRASFPLSPQGQAAAGTDKTFGEP